MPDKLNVLMGDQTSPQEPEQKRLTYRDIPPKIIKPSHLTSNMFALFVGLEADRPVTGTEKRFYFSTDTLKFSFWDGEDWKESAALS